MITIELPMAVFLWNVYIGPISADIGSVFQLHAVFTNAKWKG